MYAGFFYEISPSVSILDRWSAVYFAMRKLNLCTGNRNAATPRFHLSKDDIKADLSDQRPIYPLSCYGPGRDAPRQLIEGPVEISPEELRARYYSQRVSGNEAV